MDLLMRVKIESGSTIILITHDEDLASKYTDRIIRLADGRLVSDSQKAEQRHASAANLLPPCNEERT
jgi:ABC-type phosphate/phosphonate transport system ATPase subunit